MKTRCIKLFQNLRVPLYVRRCPTAYDSRSRTGSPLQPVGSSQAHPVEARNRRDEQESL